MKNIDTRRLLVLATALVAVSVTLAQTPAIKRTPLQKTDLQGTDREVILGKAEIAPGGETGRHTHPGIETGYVLSGSTTLEIEGEGTKVLKAGDSYTIPYGKVHNAKVTGSEPGVVLATYVVEKGKPLASPAK
jgi:quercetin dioxygenase-like cupin family protein